MSDKTRDAVIQAGMTLKGSIRNGRMIEVFGLVEGEVVTQSLRIHRGGKLVGRVRAETAEVAGLLEGHVLIKQLISIASSGSVVGNVQYGRIAMEPGGNLSAELTNVPPEIAGDFQLFVERGRSVTITTADLTAVDPDNGAEELTFAVSNLVNGWVGLASASSEPISRFTLSDIENGAIVFVHDGAPERRARFDVVVADAEGATSGQPRTVHAVVTATA